MNWITSIVSVFSWCFVASAAWTQGIDHQEATILVSSNIRVGDDLPQFPHVEPAIAVNPENADQGFRFS